MTKKHFKSLIIFWIYFLISKGLSASTSLIAGDIAFLGHNLDGSDEFALLKDIDCALDARKFSGNPDISFYSLQGEQQFAIQALPKLGNDPLEVDLGMDLRRTGNYTISMTDMDLNDQSLVVYLVDHLTGDLHSLTLDTKVVIDVTDQDETINNRFSLLFTPATVTVVDATLIMDLKLSKAILQVFL